jgi:hypothetical protein
MEQLPETAISLILSNLDTTALNSITRTSKPLTQQIAKLHEIDYQWKLMTEAYLGVEIPYDTNDWQEVYKFITLVEDDQYVFFRREVFFAQLGLLLYPDLFKVTGKAKLFQIVKLPGIIEEASIETISLLLGLPELDWYWVNIHSSFITAMKYLREDIADLLIEDGRCFKTFGGIPFTISAACRSGCGRIALRLIEKYPDHLPAELKHVYIMSCCHGLRDLADVLLELDVNMQDKYVSLGKHILEYLEDGTALPKHSSKTIENHGIFAMIVSGYTSQAYKLLAQRTIDSALTLPRSIFICIDSGNITEFDEILPYITSKYITEYKLVEHMVTRVNSNLELIHQLAQLLSNNGRNKLIKVALKHGNWRYVEYM